MSATKAAELGLTPRARFHSFAVTGSDPLYMLTGVIPATRKVLERSGLRIDEIDTYEVNEAFAPVPLCWEKELDTDPKKLNPSGGAISLGHALGASGTRLLTTMVGNLEHTGDGTGCRRCARAAAWRTPPSSSASDPSRYDCGLLPIGGGHSRIGSSDGGLEMRDVENLSGALLGPHRTHP